MRQTVLQEQNLLKHLMHSAEEIGSALRNDSNLKPLGQLLRL